MEALPWKGFKGQKDSRRALSPTIHSLLFSSFSRVIPPETTLLL